MISSVTDILTAGELETAADLFRSLFTSERLRRDRMIE